MDPSKRNAFLSGTAHEHRSHVVSPSDTTVSSRKSGLGGGGTNFPFHSPVSLASNARGDPNRSSSKFIQNSNVVSTDSKSLATEFETSENIVLAINLKNFNKNEIKLNNRMLGKVLRLLCVFLMN